MKCLVKLCPNDDSDGLFKPPLCYPCWQVLSGQYIDPAGPLRRYAVRRIVASILLAGLEVPSE